MEVDENIERREARGKATGEARYVDDLALPGMLHGLTVRSTVAPAMIRAVRLDPTHDWRGVVRVDPRDLPGQHVARCSWGDQPLLATDLTRYLHEPLLLLAAATPQRVREAAAHIEIDYEPLPAVRTLEQAQRATVHVGGGPDNVRDRARSRRGEVEAAFAAADHLVVGDYWTGPQEHLYLETQGMIAAPDGLGGLRLFGSLPCPHHVVLALSRLLRLEPQQLELIQAATGAASGGEEEYPALLAGHVALLALAAGAPVKMIHDRHEDILATTRRQPSRIHLEHAVRADGTILGLRGRLDVDGGAYAALSPVVLSRGLSHLPGPYRVPALDLEGRIFATHTAPSRALRGLGAPPASFACECQLNRIARVCGLDPLEVRLRNLLRAGDETATGLTRTTSAGLRQCLEQVLQASDYLAVRRRLQETPPVRPLRRGIGLSVSQHDAGSGSPGETGAACAWAAAIAEVAVDVDSGEVRVERILGATDAGGGPHPQRLVSRIERGLLQGVGWTYGERARSVQGRLHDERLTTHALPTLEDTPQLQVHLVEGPCCPGPSGATGAGELLLDGVAPAITLAIEEALGVTLSELPVTPEQLLGLLRQQEAAARARGAAAGEQQG